MPLLWAGRKGPASYTRYFALGMQLSPALQSPFSFHLGCGYDARKVIRIKCGTELVFYVATVSWWRCRRSVEGERVWWSSLISAIRTGSFKPARRDAIERQMSATTGSHPFPISCVSELHELCFSVSRHASCGPILRPTLNCTHTPHCHTKISP